MNSLLITGTDTDAGKTVLTSALIAYWQMYFPDRALGVMKLLQTGTGDRELYTRLFALEQDPEELNPLHFNAPLAPPIAAEREGRHIDLAKVWAALNGLLQRKDFVLVEALGGMGSPVTWELTVADIARDWRMTGVLVAPVKLGAIGQIVTNVAFARQTGVNLRGIVLNCVEERSTEEIADWTPIDLIESLTQMPVLGILPHLDDPTDKVKLARIASDLYLERLLPGVSLISQTSK